mgnify:CR=1 FL=1
MQKESDDSIVYVPTMHREFFPEGFSGCVKPLWPGSRVAIGDNEILMHGTKFLCPIPLRRQRLVLRS